MVGASLLRRAARAVADDWRAMSRQVRANLGDAPALRTYPFTSPQGRVRLHLRTHTDGSGLLFVNVLDVVHLSPSAATIARLLLDGMTPAHVQTLLSRRHPQASPAQIAADVAALAEVLQALATPTPACPTCALTVQRADLFSTRAQAPYKADLALTYACNNHCAHCYNEPGREAMPPLDTAHWRQVLRKLARIGIPHVIFTGGEPTLCDALPELIRHATKLGLVAGLNTNGRRLSDPVFARELAAAGLDHVQITLASHEASTHDHIVGAPAFEQTIAGIRNSLQAGLHTITNTTLTAQNREQSLQLVDFVAGLGVRTFAMNGMICSGGGRCNAAAIQEPALAPTLAAVRDRAAKLGLRFLWYTPTRYCQLSPLSLGLGAKSCNAAEYSICIEPDGGVLPCQSYYQPAGNLLRDDWAAIWNSDLFRTLRQRREAPVEAGLPARCHTCADLPVCGGGCMLPPPA